MRYQESFWGRSMRLQKSFREIQGLSSFFFWVKSGVSGGFLEELSEAQGCLMDFQKHARKF